MQSAWPGAVGEAVAREAGPVSERDGVVTVACRSATWAQELDLLGAQILAQVRANLPDWASLEAIRFTASGDCRLSFFLCVICRAFVCLWRNFRGFRLVDLCVLV